MVNHPNRPKKTKKDSAEAQVETAVDAAPAEDVVISYKGFDANFQCRGFQYVLGQTYEHKGEVKACSGGFHACQNPLNMLAYYSLKNGNRFARVTQRGKLSRHEDTKIASAIITIDAEIRLPDIIKDAVKWALCKAFSKTTETKKAATLGTSGNYSTAGTSGDSSTAGTSGYSSTAGTSGDSSTAGTSGYSSTAGTSGNYSTAGTSGNYSTAGTSGNYSTAGTSGDSSTAGTSGDSSTAGTSGNYSTAGTSGDSSTAGTSGDSSTAGTSGYSSTAGTSGNYSTAGTSGNYSTAGTSGNSSTAGTSGYYSTAGTSGDSSTAGTSGDYSTAGTSGNYSKAKGTGKHSCALSGGYQGRVMGAEGCALFLVYRNSDQEILHAWAGIVGRNGIKAGIWYSLGADGKPVEV